LAEEEKINKDSLEDRIGDIEKETIDLEK